MKKQAISAALAGTMLVGTMAAPAMAVSVDQFTDIKTTDWFYPYVQKVAEKDYMIGVGGNLFAPTTEMSRAMFVTVLARLEGVDEENAKSNFDDVPDNTWYTSAVNWAAENGIVEGNGAGKFMPEDEITRQDMCTMMARYVTYHQKKHNVTHVKPGTEKTFTDEDQIADYAAKFVEQCVAWGLIEGNDLGQFMPKSFATRAEAAAVISRLSWRSNGGSGGPGDDDDDDEIKTESVKYYINLKLDVPGSVATSDPEFTAAYSATITKTNGVVTKVEFDDESVSLTDVVTALIADTDGAEGGDTVLVGYVQQALNKLLKEEHVFTKEISGQTITVKIDTEGVISAQGVMNVADLIGTDGSTEGLSLLGEAVTKQEMMDLVEKIQQGGGMKFSQREIDVLTYMVDKANELKDAEDVKAKLDEYAKDNSALENAIKGISSNELYNVFDEYRTELRNLKTEVEEAGANNEIIVDAVEMKPVDLNLGKYLELANEKYVGKMDAAIARLESNLYPDDSKELIDTQTTLLKELYGYNKPSEFFTVEDEGKTLVLKDAGAYADMITHNVTQSMEFYDSLEEEESFYQGLLDRAQIKYGDKYGIEYINVSSLPGLLAATEENILEYLTDGKGDVVYTDGEIFSVKVTADEDSYDSWLNLIQGEWDVADNLPGQVPNILTDLLGDYTLSMKITKGE